MSHRGGHNHNGLQRRESSSFLRTIQKALYERYGFVFNDEDLENDEGRRRCLDLASEQYGTILRLKRSIERSQGQLYVQMRSFEQQRAQINEHRETYIHKLERIKNLDSEKAETVKAQLEQALKIEIPRILRTIDEKLTAYRRKVQDMDERLVMVKEELKDVEALFKSMNSDPPDVEMGILGDSDDSADGDYDLNDYDNTQRLMRPPELLRSTLPAGDEGTSEGTADDDTVTEGRQSRQRLL